MLKVDGLHFSYDGREVLRGVSVSFEPGSLTGLFGPNGSGKTTLFRCCLGLVRAEKGSVRYQNRDLAGLSLGQLARVVAYVPQEHRPPFPYRVKEIVLMGRTPHMRSALFELRAEDRRATAEALEAVGILDLAEERYDQLSGGQRQLVLVARALAQQTPVLILDEPTSALDFSNQNRIWLLLRRLAAEGRTVLTCSHDPNHVYWYCDRVVALRDGLVVADGPPQTALGESMLWSVYGQSCAVHQVAGVQVVVPGVDRDQGSWTGPTPREAVPEQAGIALLVPEGSAE